MKHRVRYFYDSKFRAEVDAQFQFAASATREGVWITYAIHDPTELDPFGGHPEGLIRYVGQTKNFAKRVRERMRTAGRAVNRSTNRVDGLLYDVMARGPAPRWSILEEVHTALDSLVSETNWTARLRAKGYPLVNQWAEHKPGATEIDRYQVDPKRLWRFTAEDAIGSNIDVIVFDPRSVEEYVVDLESFPPRTGLHVIRDHAKAAGRRARLRVR